MMILTTIAYADHQKLDGAAGSNFKISFVSVITASPQPGAKGADRIISDPPVPDCLSGAIDHERYDYE
jgi:hypothetical protein